MGRDPGRSRGLVAHVGAAVKTDAGRLQQRTLTRVRFGLPVIQEQPISKATLTGLSCDNAWRCKVTRLQTMRSSSQDDFEAGALLHHSTSRIRSESRLGTSNKKPPPKRRPSICKPLLAPANGRGTSDAPHVPDRVCPCRTMRAWKALGTSVVQDGVTWPWGGITKILDSHSSFASGSEWHHFDARTDER